MKNRNIVKMAVYLLLLHQIFYGQAKRKKYNISFILFFIERGSKKPSFEQYNFSSH